MKAVVFTLGCKVNSCESESLLTGLENLGYEVSENLEPADLYILNTCAVTLEAEKKSRQAVARMRKFNTNAKIIVTGCAAQRNPNAFIGKDNVYLVTGTKNKDKILSLLNSSGVILEELNREYDESLPPKTIKTRAYVKVQDGCDNFCSYCIIPYLRGRSRSRSIESIKNEIMCIKAKEIVLTAINLTAYNYNGKTIVDLIKELSDVKARIRLGSLEENIITREFLEALSNLYDFAPHFHLSLQSGCDNTLKRMNRKYKANDFKQSICLIREYFPNAGITTDIIVGFAGETDSDFKQSFDFAKDVEFSDIHCFPYSPRPGTMSYNLKDIDSNIKKERLDELMALKFELKNKFITNNLGKEFNTLFEEFDGEYTTGYTGNYIRVYIDGNYSGQMIKVLLTEQFKDGALCKIGG